MLNQVVLVGRLTSDPTTYKETEATKIILAVPRSYKNAEGEYDTDFIPCILWKSISDNVMKFCHKGDLVGIKGRIQMINDSIEIVAEKVTFLSNSKKEEDM